MYQHVVTFLYFQFQTLLGFKSNPKILNSGISVLMLQNHNFVL